MNNMDGINMSNYDLPLGGSTTVGSTTVTSPSSTAQQTFTTAGTPYRPAMQSFQRPERRNRYRADDGVQNGLSLLPKHDMHRMLANGGLVPGTVPHYTPLQQNNDRAANPARPLELLSPSMGSVSPPDGSGRPHASPLMLNFGSSGGSSQHRAGAYNDEDIDNEGADDYESDDDVAFTKNPLSNMTVKSIQNLASYSNPNQAIARRYLAQRARKGLNRLIPSNGGPAGSSGRALEPRSSFMLGEESVSPTSKYSTRFNGSPVSFDAVDQYATRMHAGPSNSARTSNFASRLADGHEVNRASSTILAPGPGAPRPLTAGPPGQRRLSISVINSTDRERRAQKPDVHFENKQMYPVLRHLLPEGVADGPTSLPYMLGAIVDSADYANFGDWPSTIEKANVYHDVQVPLGNMDKVAIDTSSALMNDGAYDQSPSDWGYTQATPTFLGMMPSRLGVRYEEGTGRMTKETIQARADKINRDWYSGADLFSRPDITLPREGSENERSNAPAASTTAGAMPSQYRQLDIKSANRMRVGELAAPLVEVLVAKLALFISDEQGTSTSRGPSIWPLE